MGATVVGGGPRPHCLLVRAPRDCAPWELPNRMSSGTGTFTAKGRCHGKWTEYLQCRDENLYPGRHCAKSLEDYLECLHRKKEVRLASARVARSRRHSFPRSSEHGWQR